MSSLISSLASVHPNANIGEGVEIGPFAVVEDNVVIGANTKIHPHAIIRSGARIGCECEIHPNAVISGIPQDLKFIGEDSIVEIGKKTQIRECVTVNRGTASRGKTIIGTNCLLMAYSHIGHDCVLQNNIIIGNGTQIAGEVEIDDFAIVSAGSLVHQFTRISKHVMVQGGSKIPKDLPPYVLVGREPISYCGINIIGLRRRGFSNDQISEINDMYRTIYQRGLNTTQALALIMEEHTQSFERDLIIDFIKKSERGIVKGMWSD